MLEEFPDRVSVVDLVVGRTRGRHNVDVALYDTFAGRLARTSIGPFRMAGARRSW